MERAAWMDGGRSSLEGQGLEVNPGPSSPPHSCFNPQGTPNQGVYRNQPPRTDSQVEKGRVGLAGYMDHDSTIL